MNTYNELVDYIKSIESDHAFTQDEFLDIGRKHKELPRSEKCWSQLAEDVGYPGTSEAYRKFVYYHDKQESEITSATSRKSYEEEYKEVTKVRDAYNEYRLDLRKEARWEAFRDSIITEVSKLPALNILPSPKITQSEKLKGKEAILPFADLHLGPEFSNYFNSYNFDKAVERVNLLITKTIAYCKTLNVTTLHFLNMGDLVSGIIHPTIRLGQQQDCITTLMKAAELVAEVLARLSENIPQVTYRSVIDNHGRLNANVAENLNEENMNRIIDWFVEERLKNSNVEFIKDNIDLQIGRFRLNNNKLVIFSHGHNEKKTSCFQDIVGLTHEFPDYILLAHYHNTAVHTFHGAKVFISGSIIGTDPYAFDHRLFGYPEQSLLIFNDDDVINVSVLLDAPKFIQ